MDTDQHYDYEMSKVFFEQLQQALQGYLPCRGSRGRARVVFPVHPKMRRCLAEAGLWEALARSGAVLTEP